MKEIGEGVEAVDFCDGARDSVDESEIGKAAESCSDVAATYVKGDEELGCRCGQDGSYICQRTFVAYGRMRLLGLDSQRDSNRMNTPLEDLLHGDTPGAG